MKYVSFYMLHELYCIRNTSFHFLLSHLKFRFKLIKFVPLSEIKQVSMYIPADAIDLSYLGSKEGIELFKRLEKFDFQKDSNLKVNFFSFSNKAA